MRRLVVSVAFLTIIAPPRMRTIPTRLAHRGGFVGAKAAPTCGSPPWPWPEPARQGAFDEQADDAGVDEGIVGATWYGGAIVAVRNWARSVFATQAIHQRWKQRRRTVCGLSTSTRRQRRRRGHRQD